MVAKSKKKARRRKRVPVSKLVHPAGLRFDQTPGFAQWVPYVQRLTYEPQPNPVLQQKAMERQLEPRLHSGIRVMNPSLISTQTQTQTPPDTQTTQMQTDFTGPLLSLISTQTPTLTPSKKPTQPIQTQTDFTGPLPETQVFALQQDPIDRQQYRHMDQRQLLMAHGLFGDPKLTTGGWRIQSNALEAFGEKRGVPPPMKYDKEMFLEDLRYEARTSPTFVDQTLEYADDLVNPKPKGKAKLLLPPPAAGGPSSRQSSSDGVPFI